MVAIAAEVGGEWWPRNRRPEDGNKRLTSFSASRPGLCSAKLLEDGRCGQMLILSVSAATEGSQCRPDGQSSRSYVYSGAPGTAGGRSEMLGKLARRSMPHASCPRERRPAQRVGAATPGGRMADVQLMHAVSRLQNATWRMREVSGWQKQGRCMMLSER